MITGSLARRRDTKRRWPSHESKTGDKMGTALAVQTQSAYNASSISDRLNLHPGRDLRHKRTTNARQSQCGKSPFESYLQCKPNANPIRVGHVFRDVVDFSKCRKLRNFAELRRNAQKTRLARLETRRPEERHSKGLHGDSMGFFAGSGGIGHGLVSARPLAEVIVRAPGLA